MKAEKRLNPDANSDALREVIKQCFDKGEAVGDALVAGALLEVASALREHSSMLFEHHQDIRTFLEPIAAKFDIGDHTDGDDDDDDQDEEPGDAEPRKDVTDDDNKTNHSKTG